MSRRSALPFVLAAASLLTSCREARVGHYRVPKETPPPAATAPATDMASTAVPTGDGQLTWTAPAAWIAKAPGAMRKGSYAIRNEAGEADLSITAFPGDTGGLLANLNRWRGQIGLAPLAPAELEANLDHLDANGLHFEIVDFAGTANGAPARILGAVLNRPGETWFFKLMGPAATVAGEKPAFAAFLQTVKAP
ncbi:MAG: hypothetical protein IPN11_16170 [Opitutaceae bacterium]|nr:hypothetical protein [Opitutaceae bacterium]